MYALKSLRICEKNAELSGRGSLQRPTGLAEINRYMTFMSRNFINRTRRIWETRNIRNRLSNSTHYWFSSVAICITRSTPSREHVRSLMTHIPFVVWPFYRIEIYLKTIVGACRNFVNLCNLCHKQWPLRMRFELAIKIRSLYYMPRSVIGE